MNDNDRYAREYEADAFWGGDAPRWKPKPLLTPEEQAERKEALQYWFDKWAEAGMRFKR